MQQHWSAASRSTRPDSDVPMQFNDRVNGSEVICNLDFDYKDESCEAGEEQEGCQASSNPAFAKSVPISRVFFQDTMGWG